MPCRGFDPHVKPPIRRSTTPPRPMAFTSRRMASSRAPGHSALRQLCQVCPWDGRPRSTRGVTRSPRGALCQSGRAFSGPAAEWSTLVPVRLKALPGVGGELGRVTLPCVRTVGAFLIGCPGIVANHRWPRCSHPHARRGFRTWFDRLPDLCLPACLERMWVSVSGARGCLGAAWTHLSIPVVASS